MMFMNMPQAYPPVMNNQAVGYPLGGVGGMLPGTKYGAPCGAMAMGLWGQPIAAVGLAAAQQQQQKKKKKRKPIELGKKHRAVVTRIGDEPLLKIEDLGEFRFAYRSVKRFPKGSSRPFVMVGDGVECRLCVGPNPPVAYSVKIINKVDDEPPALLDGDGQGPESDSDDRSTSTDTE